MGTGDRSGDSGSDRRGTGIDRGMGSDRRETRTGIDVERTGCELIKKEFTILYTTLMTWAILYAGDEDGMEDIFKLYYHFDPVREFPLFQRAPTTYLGLRLPSPSPSKIFGRRPIPCAQSTD